MSEHIARESERVADDLEITAWGRGADKAEAAVAARARIADVKAAIDEGETHVCAECGEAFDTAAALAGHGNAHD